MKKHQFKFSNGYIVELQNISPNVFGQNVSLQILKRKSWCDYYIGSSGTDSYSANRQGYFAPPDAKNGYNTHKVLFETTLYYGDIRKILHHIKQSYKEKEINNYRTVAGAEHINLTGFDSDDSIWFAIDSEGINIRIKDKHFKSLFSIDDFATTKEVLEFIEFVENLFNNKKEDNMKNEKHEITIGNSENKIVMAKRNENEYESYLYQKIIKDWMPEVTYYYNLVGIRTLSKADLKSLVQFFNSFIEDEKKQEPDAKLYELLEKLPEGWSISRGKRWGYDGDIYYLTSDTGKSFSLGDLSNLAKEAFLLFNEYYRTIPFEELVGRQIKLKVHPASPLHNDIFYVLNYFVRTRHEDRAIITEKYINVSNSRTNQIEVISKKDYEDNYKVV